MNALPFAELARYRALAEEAGQPSGGVQSWQWTVNATGGGGVSGLVPGPKPTVGGSMVSYTLATNNVHSHTMAPPSSAASAYHAGSGGHVAPPPSATADPYGVPNFYLVNF